eukprot:COSAG02_NODE_6658_length_3433_cov_2.642771_5_plen_44_part_00
MGIATVVLPEFDSMFGADSPVRWAGRPQNQFVTYASFSILNSH